MLYRGWNVYYVLTLKRPVEIKEEGSDEVARVEWTQKSRSWRYAAALGSLLFGAAVTGGAILHYSRMVRRMHILPARIRTEPTKIMIEDSLHRPVRGRMFDINAVSLEKTSSKGTCYAFSQ